MFKARSLALILLLAACSAPQPITTKPSASPSPAASANPPKEPARIAKRQGHQQGPLKATGRALDWAIDGPGYFLVLDPKDGKPYYTRNGAFQLSAKGEVVNKDGHLLGQVVAFMNPGDFSHISETGVVWSKNPKGDLIQSARVIIYLFAKPDKLKAIAGRDGLFEATAESGPAEQYQPKQNGAGFIAQSTLEDFSVAAAALPDPDCKQPRKAEAGKDLLDWAIEGPGYFLFLDPSTGDEYFTRRGRIKVDSNGQLVSEQGYTLSPSVVIPPGQQLLRIDADGTLWSSGDKGEPFKLGRLTLAQVEKPAGLQSVGFSRPSFYFRTAAAGAIKEEYAASAGLGTIKSNQLESCGQDIPAFASDLLSKLSGVNLAM